MNYGFVRVAAAKPRLKVAECRGNTDQILLMMEQAQKRGCSITVFPELCITAYTCGDLFQQQALLLDAEQQLQRVVAASTGSGMVTVVGLPVYIDNQLFNCGVAVQDGKILGVVPKLYIPNYSEFYEQRWFASGRNTLSDHIILCGQRVPFGTDLIFQAEEQREVCFGIELCEDLWVPIPPSSYQAMAGATILLNLSASNEIIGKHEYRRDIVTQQSAKAVAAYVYASAGVDESTTDVVFGGHCLIAEYGILLAETERLTMEEALILADVDVEKLASDRRRNTSFMTILPEMRFRKIYFTLGEKDFSTLERYIDPHPFVPSNPEKRDSRCSEIFAIQTNGMAKRLRHTKARCAVIGISGGLDSTLALLVAVKAFDMLGMDRKDIIAVTMPGFGTTNETYNNAMQFMQSLHVTIREINIRDACLQHFKDIGHDPAIHDVTYENVQARERTQILMDIANKHGGWVIGTGDLSELALGWSTYNGDHMSMYGVNSGIPKTLVQFLVKWAAEHVVDEAARSVLYRILDTPISPELLPPDASGAIHQKTEDIIGPYELHDFFLYHVVRYGAQPKKVQYLANHAFGQKYDPQVIFQWLQVFYKRFFSQQFKRSCLPDGPKVGTISLSPRGDWRMPSDAEVESWLRQLDA